jgi:hypothetical protein
MEVPVFVIFYKTNIRFSPYKDWLHMVNPDEFMRDEYDYDFLNPKPNKTDHIETRDKLRADLEAWVAEAAKMDRVPKELPYTEEEKKAWQYSLMKDTLNKWLKQNNGMAKKVRAAAEADANKQSNKQGETTNFKKVINHLRVYGLRRTIKKVLTHSARQKNE